MNAKKAKKARQLAKKFTEHLPDNGHVRRGGQTVLSECKRGAYKAIKRGKIDVAL